MAAGRDRVAGKIALVTGGGSGIGRATCRALAEQGARVIAADIDAEAAAATADMIVEAAEWVSLDVTDEARWEAVLGDVVARHGRLDVLVNNAGIAINGTIEDTTLADWRKVHAVNAEGPFLGCKHGVRAMKETGGGSIVNVSSIAGIVGAPTLAAYCSSKGSVRLLTKSVALHCARKGYGIRCNSVHPSYADTPMVDAMVANHRDPARYRSALDGAAPLGRLASAEDVAAAIVYLASDDSAFQTGSEIIVDGGVTAT